MKVLFANHNIVFLSKIIDTHTHVGSLGKDYYKKSDLDVFVKEKLPNNDTVEKMFVSDSDIFNGKKKEYEGNAELLKIFSGDKNYELFATCSPNNGDVKNIEKLYRENPNTFIGLKFHPTIQKLSPSDTKYNKYMEFADKNGIPCLFHCAVNVDSSGRLDKTNMELSDPEKIYELAKKYKRTPVVMAHMGAGWNESHDKAIEVLKDSIKNSDANLYADISWVDIDSAEVNGHKTKEHILKAIKTLKGIGDQNWTYGDQSYRLMFGTDAPVDRFSQPDRIKHYTNFIEDIKYAIRNDADLKNDSEKIIDDLFYNNAKKLYLDKKNKTKKNKAIIIVSSLLVMSAGILGLVKYKMNQRNKQK